MFEVESFHDRAFENSNFGKAEGVGKKFTQSYVVVFNILVSTYCKTKGGFGSRVIDI